MAKQFHAVIAEKVAIRPFSNTAAIPASVMSFSWNYLDDFNSIFFQGFPDTLFRVCRTIPSIFFSALNAIHKEFD